MKVHYLLDTDTFSCIINGTSQAARARYKRFLGDPDARICISAITEAEVRHGMEKRELGRVRRDAIEKLFLTVNILPWGSEEAVVYGRTKAALDRQGLSVALMDTLIAAHAASLGAVLVTRDDIFPRTAGIAGMSGTENWATDVGAAKAR